MKRFIAVLTCLMALGGLVSVIASAQPAPESSSGLQISPTRSELTINPGKSDTITLNIKNITGGNIIAKAEVDDFKPDNDTGTPRLLTNLNGPAPTSIKPFMPFIADVNLKAGEIKKVAITLKVPQDQPAGGYFGVLRFKAFPASIDQNNSGKQVSLTASVGHIILVQVPGQITEKLEALNLSAEYHKKPGNFFIHPPDGMRLEVKNIGNSVLLKPFGNVSIRDGAGREVYKYEINATEPRGNVLPKSSRIFHNDIKNIKSFGRYSAIASVSYGSGGDVLALKTSFWVVPLWLLIVAVVIVLLLITGIVLLYHRFRRHRRGYQKRI